MARAARCRKPRGLGRLLAHWTLGTGELQNTSTASWGKVAPSNSSTMWRDLLSERYWRGPSKPKGTQVVNSTARLQRLFDLLTLGEVADPCEAVRRVAAEDPGDSVADGAEEAPTPETDRRPRDAQLLCNVPVLDARCREHYDLCSQHLPGWRLPSKRPLLEDLSICFRQLMRGAICACLSMAQ